MFTTKSYYKILYHPALTMRVHGGKYGKMGKILKSDKATPENYDEIWILLYKMPNLEECQWQCRPCWLYLFNFYWLSFPQHVNAGQRAVGVSSGLPLLSQSLLLMHSYSMYSRLASLRAYRRLACLCLLAPQGNAGITHVSHCIQLFIWFLELELSH